MKKYKGCLLTLALSMGLTGCSQMSEADRVLEGTEVKGAVLINAGGAFMFRSD